MSRHVSSLSQQLVELQSPSVFTDATMEDLTSSQFASLCCFLCHKVDPTVFTNIQAKHSNNPQAVVAEFVSILGMKLPDKPAQHEAFLTDLVDLCTLKHVTYQTPGSLSTKLAACSGLMTYVAENQSAIFDKIELFPVDMQPLLKKSSTSSRGGTTQLESLQGFSEALKTQVRDLSRSLDILIDKTPDFNAGQTAAELKVSAEAMGPLQTAIADKFKQLKVLLTRFSEVYRQDFLPWAHLSAPGQSETPEAQGTLAFFQWGAKAPELLQHVTSVDKVLAEIEQTRLNYAALLNTPAPSVLNSMSSTIDLELASLKAKDAVAILRQAIQRISETQ